MNQASEPQEDRSENVFDGIDLESPDALMQLCLALVGQIKTLNDRLGEVTKKRKHERRVGIIAIAALCVDLVITPFIGVVSVQAFNSSSNANTLATANKISLYTSCTSGNDFRKADLRRWNFFIDLLAPPGQPHSAAVTAAVAEIKLENAKTDALRDCKKFLNPGDPS